MDWSKLTFVCVCVCVCLCAFACVCFIPTQVAGNRGDVGDRQGGDLRGKIEAKRGSLSLHIVELNFYDKTCPNVQYVNCYCHVNN